MHNSMGIEDSNVVPTVKIYTSLFSDFPTGGIDIPGYWLVLSSAWSD